MNAKKRRSMRDRIRTNRRLLTAAGTSPSALYWAHNFGAAGHYPLTSGEIPAIIAIVTLPGRQSYWGFRA